VSYWSCDILTSVDRTGDDSVYRTHYCQEDATEKYVEDGDGRKHYLCVDHAREMLNSGYIVHE